MHLVAPICMFISAYMLIYTCIHVYKGVFWLVFESHPASPMLQPMAYNKQ